MQQIHLSIPEPCHENWQEMTSTQQGRFCNACAKEVVDFSTMTDHEVLNYFSKKATAKVCGRFIPEQLDRPIHISIPARKRRYWYWNYAAAFFLLFSRSSTVNAQGKVKIEASPISPDNRHVPLGGMVMIQKMTDQPVVVSGRVVDEKGKPITNATVRIKSGKAGTMTNNEGQFKLFVSASDQILETSAAGYKTKEYILTKESRKDILLELALQTTLLSGEVMIINNGENNNITSKYSTAQFDVTDEETGLPVWNAKIWFTRKSGKALDTGRTDRKGIYKLKRIPNEYAVTVKITAEGYKEKSLEINSENFTRHKEVITIRLDKIPIVKNLAPVVVSSMGIIKKAVTMGTTLTIATTSIDMIHYPSQVLAGNLECGKIDSTIVQINSSEKQPSTKMGGLVAGMQIHLTRPIFQKDTLINKVKSLFSSANIKVYPNPVIKGHDFFISLKLKQTGNINIRLLNLSGNILLEQRSVDTGKESICKIQVGEQWAAGMYFIEVFDDKNNLIGKSNFIVQ